MLGYGNGGQNTLADSKRHKALKPNWFPSSVAFDGPDAYTNPTKASLEKNEDVIESILKYFKYDPRTHCELGCPLFRKMSLMDFIMGDMLRLYVKVTQKKFQSFIFMFDR